MHLADTNTNIYRLKMSNILNLNPSKCILIIILIIVCDIRQLLLFWTLNI